MPDLIVTGSLCTRCGACVATCPARIIELPKGVPRFTATGEARCIICGHCEAVCPTAALTVNDPRLDPTVPPPPEAPLPPEILDAYLRMRRSIRRFRTEAVPRKTIESLLDVVRYAPTSSNRQAVRWLVIHDTAEVRRLTGLVIDWFRSRLADPSCPNRTTLAAMIRSWNNGSDPICRNAPHLVIPCTPRQHSLAPFDATIAAAHLEIVAPAHGIGTCWGGYFQMAAEVWEPLRLALNLSDGYYPECALLLGYPATTYRRPPKRNRLDVTWR
ncbi:nitroreductase [Geobacter metallireducens RCH3]|uniref:Ferredoxin and NADH nitroreductase domain protein n=1 Tax=Geobacter metallireducens (strain ATCC 53774 / DSM 7210 / GS-15) TaxID=269799 RepID=Q39RB4_GEOMG|nr:nitroreductase family protein [Geobacter metallireducens]ABB33210.1 ferredoxin and NADH nitroreductase domain protein [Geobacter metallireducens GS-15]EHP84423.1 nitroreductase [Geobacter metallireducens RCH3]